MRSKIQPEMRTLSMKTPAPIAPAPPPKATRASSRMVIYHTGTPKRNRVDLAIGLLSAAAVIAGVGWGGELFRKGPPKAPPPMEIPAIQITMPNLETETQTFQDTNQTSAPAEIAPPMQTDVPQIATDTSFVQPLQPSPPQNLSVNTGTVVIPANFSGGYAKGMEVFDISKLDQIPEPIYRPQPVYPYEMRKQGVSGQVVIQFIVERDGSVSSAFVISSSNHDFEQSALDGVSRWRFRAGRRNGLAVRTRMEVPVVFNLEND
jgi:periplasmic protein TonB